MNPSPKIGFVSLGCPKALVDSERILTRLKAEGYVTVADYDGADVIVVNTCGFLDSARDESLDAIGEAMAENGQVIVTGCLGHDADLIRQRHPGVLAVTGPQAYDAVIDAVHDAVPPPHDPFVDLIPPGGIRLTPRHYAYLKISEGCNHHCRFCIIPTLRGRLASRTSADILTEAEALADAGVKELIVIAQDTSAYGVDIGYESSEWRGQPVKARITELCEALSELGLWTRLHYVYPYPHVDELIPLMAEGRLLPYLDIPFQHASPTILRAMRRPASEARTLERIASWRRQVPELTLRSSFIVGFPGETDEDFDQLIDWLHEADLDRVGCFRYEPVTGAAANQLPNAVPPDVTEDRWHRLMSAQQEISRNRLAQKIGRKIEVIVDAMDADNLIGRSTGDAPEIDGKVFLPLSNESRVGDWVTAVVDDADAYDLWARPVPA
jgi:ribosomal protein S12 methylthiotransferase